MTTLSQQALRRLPDYLEVLRRLPTAGHISATAIAEALGLNDVQVRKDLAAVSARGRPKVGYLVKELTEDIEKFLGYDDAHSAALVGVGNLGRALLLYEGFSTSGLNITLGFDVDPALVGRSLGGKPIFPVEQIPELCARMKIRIGVIATPASEAQAACDALVRGGVLAIWNFAPARLTTPPDVWVQHENMTSSITLLSKHVEAVRTKKRTD